MKGLAVLVTGGRFFADRDLVFATLDRIHAATPVVTLIHGGCRENDLSPFRGADGLADEWARSRGVRVEAYPVFDADWGFLGKAAGPRRNKTMVTRLAFLRDRYGYRVECVAFEGQRGTANCKKLATAAGVVVTEVSEVSGEHERS